MIQVAAVSVHRLAQSSVVDDEVMSWTCPVPYFGKVRDARVATLGINPSNREFVDEIGNELDGLDRRFPTLMSLGLDHWGEASSLDMWSILDACDDYFEGNPYDRWFRVLDHVLSESGSSYYCSSSPAVHLDLVPYATGTKWGELRPSQQRELLGSGGDLLGALLRDSQVQVLVLNGRSVVREFVRVSDVELHEQRRPEWDLKRQGSGSVEGFGYVGTVESVGGIDLGRSISVLGFNVNVQSSFGVTRGALGALAKWVAVESAR